MLHNPGEGKPPPQESFRLPRLNTLSKHRGILRSKGAKGNLLNDTLEEESHCKVMSVVEVPFAH